MCIFLVQKPQCTLFLWWRRCFLVCDCAFSVCKRRLQTPAKIGLLSEKTLSFLPVCIFLAQNHRRLILPQRRCCRVYQFAFFLPKIIFENPSEDRFACSQSDVAFVNMHFSRGISSLETPVKCDLTPAKIGLLSVRMLSQTESVTQAAILMSAAKASSG